MTHTTTSTVDVNVEIPKVHQAAIYDKPGSISTKVVEVETPEPGPGEVLIRLYVFVLLFSHHPAYPTKV
jgi:hypothetical protein